MKLKYTSVLQTERLCLQEIRNEDLDSLFELLTNEEVGKTYMVPTFSCREEATSLLARLQALSRSDERFVYGIYLNDRLIGMINDVDVSGSEIELGYAIHPAYHNRGYATEALAAAMQALFAQGITAVKAGAFEENLASMRVMEKCGMLCTEEVEYVEYRGKRQRCICYKKEK